MDRAQRRNVALVVIATVLLGVGIIVWFALRDAPDTHIEGIFDEDTAFTQWPPESNADLEAEIAITAAARRIGATGILRDFDAGPGGPHIPGLQVRTGLFGEIYYIEAVLGHDVDLDDPMPMAVLIHGRGDRARIPGGPFWGLGGPIRVIVPQAPDPLGNGFEWLPVRVGQNLVDRLTTSLLARAAELATMLRELSRELPTIGRPMVVGFSQGGLLTFALATHHTDVVQAAFPLSAWLPPAMVPPYRRDDLRYPRIRGVHGLADRIIEPEPTVELYQALSDRGFEAELELFDGVEHEMSEAMNAQLHAWLAEEMGVLLAEAGVDLPDAERAPCLPAGMWPPELVPDGGWPEAGPPEAGWPAAYRPEAGWPEGGWPLALRPEAGWPDDRPPAWEPCVEPAAEPERATDADAAAGVPGGGYPDESAIPPSG